MYDRLEIQECLLRAHNALAVAHSIADEANKLTADRIGLAQRKDDEAEQFILPRVSECKDFRSSKAQNNRGNPPVL